MTHGFLSGRNLHRDVVTFTRAGDHRSGSSGEEAATEWIAAELARAGLSVSFQEFPLRQFCVRRSSLQVGGTGVDCFPWWYPRRTGPSGVRGALVPGGSARSDPEGAVVLWKPEAGKANQRAEMEDMVARLASAGALAVLAVSAGPSGEIVAINTPEATEPWPIPVVLVGGKDSDALARAAASEAEASLVVDGTDDMAATARNVFGRHGRDGDIIVVSTPKSGWFGCGGERGPGVALALALARWVGRRRPAVGYWFDFNSGHELFNLGTRRFLGDVAPPASRVRCWLHLGANIGTWDYVETEGRVQARADPGRYLVPCKDDSVLVPVARGFGLMPEVGPYVGEGIGELGPVFEAGYRGFGVYGGRYRHFHTPVDGADGTSPELLAPVAEALVRTLGIMESGAY